MRYIGLMLLALGLAACGFQLRGTEQIAFKKIHIQGATLSLSRDLVQAFKVNDVEVVSSPDKADIILDLIAERNQKIFYR